MTDNHIVIAKIQPTPLGMIWLGVTSNGLASISFFNTQSEFEDELTDHGYEQITTDNGYAQKFVNQIQQYLHAERQQFDLPIDWRIMTPFQQQVLQATQAIPYGETRSYAQIAAQIGKPRAARAVGRAQATNPIPLVIPCHRVIGSDGKLHGYGGRGGIRTKAWLLALESGEKLPPPIPVN